MSKVYGQNAEKIANYVEEVFVPDDKSLREVRASAVAAKMPDIHVAPMDGLHLEVLAAATHAKKAVEIGTLAGYSGIRILRGMNAAGKSGKLYTFEYEPKHAEVAKANFEKTGYANQTEIFVGEALTNLKKIESEGPFDLVFIDADKANYSNYFDWAAKNLRVGGVVIGDNCFAWGTVCDTQFENPNSRAMAQALNEFNVGAARHPNFRTTMIPTGEGMLLAVKIAD